MGNHWKFLNRNHVLRSACHIWCFPVWPFAAPLAFPPTLICRYSMLWGALECALCAVQCFPTGHSVFPALLVRVCCNLFIALPPHYSWAVEERSGFLISVSSVLHTRLIFSRYSVDIYRVCGRVNAFWHETSTLYCEIDWIERDEAVRLAGASYSSLGERWWVVSVAIEIQGWKWIPETWGSRTDSKQTDQMGVLKKPRKAGSKDGAPEMHPILSYFVGEWGSLSVYVW